MYSDTATGAQSGVVSGNAATNGLLDALNSYLSSAPASTTPSGLTSTITAAASSITANGTSTTTITVQLKDVNGNNLTTGGNTVTLSTTAGTLSSVTDNGNGTYTATLTSSTSITTATITGTVDGPAISDDAQVQFVSTSSVAGTLTRANGSAVSGRTVKLVNSSSQIVATTTTASNGTYSFSAVAPGTYSIQFEGSGSYKAKAKSGTGSNQGNVVSSVTVGSSSTITGVDAVVIDPAGVIYDSTSRAPLANAVASLWYNNAKVNNSQLDTGLGGANDQTTGSDGSYSFVLNSSASSGTYEIRVVAPSGYTGTPSSNIPASGTYTPSLGGGLESIQSQSTAPTGLQPTTYYLLFNFTIGSNAAGTSNGVINNHIPLDPIIAAPVFTNTNATDGSNNPSYSFTYDENRAAGATLGTVSATGTGSLSYAITAGNGSSWFAIDATTGVITMTQAGATSLANDYETVANVQTLTVQVSDGTRSLGDMLSFNEQLLGDDDAGQCNAQKGKPVSGGFNANNQAQSARLNFAQKKEDCERRYRVYLNGAIAVSRLHGDWMTRTMASARIETDLNPTLVVGAGVLTTFADDKIRGFASSDISDTSVQLNLYGRKRLTDVLRMAAFAGYGKAWYDFGLTDNGFAMTGKMTGDRFTYGATLTGDIVIGETPITTDVIISRATEKLGAASLNATYLGEARSGIGFHIGNVDMTRLSVPVHLPIDFQKSAYEGGNAARLEFSPGLLCEDQSADASTLSCGFKADAKLTFTHGIRSRAYLDASFETVSGMERYMAGMGFGYRFGPKNALEVGMSLNGGTTGLRQEARALLQIRVAQ